MMEDHEIKSIILDNILCGNIVIENCETTDESVIKNNMFRSVPTSRSISNSNRRIERRKEF